MCESDPILENLGTKRWREQRKGRRFHALCGQLLPHALFFSFSSFSTLNLSFTFHRTYTENV